MSTTPTPIAQPGDELLTADAVAKHLNLSRETVYRMVRDRKLPVVKLGSSRRAPVRIRRRDLEAFVADSIVEAR